MSFRLEYTDPNLWMTPVEDSESKVTVHREGSLIEIQGGVQLPFIYRSSSERTNGREVRKVKRGLVKGYSGRSRQRFIAKCAKLADQGELPLMVTLTYPGNLRGNLRSRSKWKRDLNLFYMWLKRKYPEFAGLWRLEKKKRLSGISKGQVAPHFHILIWKLEFLPHFELAQAWYDIVASAQKDHLSAGVSVEQVESRNGIMCYAAKYVQKPEDEIDDDGFLGGQFCGRVWGVWNQKNFVWSSKESPPLSGKEVTVYRRTVRRYCEKKGVKACWRAKKVNLYTRDFTTFDRLARWIWKQGLDDPDWSITSDSDLAFSA